MIANDQRLIPIDTLLSSFIHIIFFYIKRGRSTSSFAWSTVLDADVSSVLLAVKSSCRLVVSISLHWKTSITFLFLCKYVRWNHNGGLAGHKIESISLSLRVSIVWIHKCATIHSKTKLNDAHLFSFSHSMNIGDAITRCHSRTNTPPLAVYRMSCDAECVLNFENRRGCNRWKFHAM